MSELKYVCDLWVNILECIVWIHYLWKYGMNKGTESFHKHICESFQLQDISNHSTFCRLTITGYLVVQVSLHLPPHDDRLRVIIFW